MYWHILRHPIMYWYTVTSETFYRCWYIMYHPQLRVRIPYANPNSELGILYHPRAWNGIFWAQNRTVAQDSGH